MSLRLRKTVVIVLIGCVFLMANVAAIASWLVEKGVPEKAGWIRREFLTGTAITVIVALLVLLVAPGRASGWARRCPVCDRRLLTGGNYCSACGSRVAVHEQRWR